MQSMPSVSKEPIGQIPVSSLSLSKKDLFTPSTISAMATRTISSLPTYSNPLLINVGPTVVSTNGSTTSSTNTSIPVGPAKVAYLLPGGGYSAADPALSKIVPKIRLLQKIPGTVVPALTVSQTTASTTENNVIINVAKSTNSVPPRPLLQGVFKPPSTKGSSGIPKSTVMFDSSKNIILQLPEISTQSGIKLTTNVSTSTMTNRNCQVPSTQTFRMVPTGLPNLFTAIPMRNDTVGLQQAKNVQIASPKLPVTSAPFTPQASIRYQMYSPNSNAAVGQQQTKNMLVSFASPRLPVSTTSAQLKPTEEIVKNVLTNMISEVTNQTPPILSNQAQANQPLIPASETVKEKDTVPNPQVLPKDQEIDKVPNPSDVSPNITNPLKMGINEEMALPKTKSIVQNVGPVTVTHLTSEFPEKTKKRIRKIKKPFEFESPSILPKSGMISTPDENKKKRAKIKKKSKDTANQAQEEEEAPTVPSEEISSLHDDQPKEKTKKKVPVENDRRGPFDKKKLSKKEVKKLRNLDKEAEKRSIKFKRTSVGGKCGKPKVFLHWLMDLINSGRFKEYGTQWVDKDAGIFDLQWPRHAENKFDPGRAEVFLDFQRVLNRKDRYLIERNYTKLKAKFRACIRKYLHIGLVRISSSSRNQTTRFQFKLGVPKILGNNKWVFSKPGKDGKEIYTEMKSATADTIKEMAKIQAEAKKKWANQYYGKNEYYAKMSNPIDEEKIIVKEDDEKLIVKKDKKIVKKDRKIVKNEEKIVKKDRKIVKNEEKIVKKDRKIVKNEEKIVKKKDKKIVKKEEKIVVKKEDTENHVGPDDSFTWPNNLNICKTCNERFETPNELEHHVQIHENEMPHSCEICNKRFKDLYLLVRHLATHDSTECKNCWRRFVGSDHLANHVCEPVAASSKGMKRKISHHSPVESKKKLLSKDELNSNVNTNNDSASSDGLELMRAELSTKYLTLGLDDPDNPFSNLSPKTDPKQGSEEDSLELMRLQLSAELLTQGVDDLQIYGGTKETDDESEGSESNVSENNNFWTSGLSEDSKYSDVWESLRRDLGRIYSNEIEDSDSNLEEFNQITVDHSAINLCEASTSKHNSSSSECRRVERMAKRTGPLPVEFNCTSCNSKCKSKKELKVHQAEHRKKAVRFYSVNLPPDSMKNAAYRSKPLPPKS